MDLYSTLVVQQPQRIGILTKSVLKLFFLSLEEKEYRLDKLNI